MKKWIFLILFFLTVGLLEVKYLLTDGFSLKRINYKGHYRIENEISEPLDEKKSELFAHPFFYLGKGRQTYVFESEDKKYVLKFVRYHKYRHPFWKRFVFHFVPLKKIQKNFEDRNTKLEFAMNSYKIAYRELPGVTQVEYIHLNQTNFLNKRVEVRDKLGIKHFVDLDRVAFVLQKKSKPLKKTLINLIQNKKEDEVKKVIDSFFANLSLRVEKKIVNIDNLNLIRNCGIDGLSFIEQDVGSFVHIRKDEDNFKNHTEEFMRVFRSFLKINSRDLLPYFDEKSRDIRKCLKK